MAKTKQKTLVDAKKIRKAGVPAPRHASNEANSTKSEVTPSALVTAWKEEIRSLRKKTYVSEEQAIGELVSRVVTRVNTPQDLVERTTQFLTELFDTDPGLKADIRQVLKIKS